jgi:tetratricopeptide (TPR) repeat protein
MTLARGINAILLAALLSATAHASEETAALLRKAKQARAIGDDRSAVELVSKAIKQDPNDLEARWSLIGLVLAEIGSLSAPQRAVPLAQTNGAFKALTEMAKKTNQTAFLHYITAMYATYYKNYERAVAEIDKALVLEPKSTRFLAAKGKILGRYGEWTGNTKRQESGIQYLKQVATLAASDDEEAEDLDFTIASAIAKLHRPRWPEVVQHYERYLKQANRKSTDYAFAWNNLSIAYRKLGECQKAKSAAEAALRLEVVGPAQRNLNHAEFCLEMRRLGMATHFTEEAEPEFSH